MLCKREESTSTSPWVRKPEFSVQPSSNLRFGQLPARLPALPLVGDYLHGRAGGNGCMSSHKSLQGEVQELRISPCQYLSTSGMCTQAVLLCRPEVPPMDRHSHGLKSLREIEGLLLALSTPSWKATWTQEGHILNLVSSTL